MFHMDEELMQKMRKKNATIYINITNECNGNCRCCMKENSKTILEEATKSQVLEWIHLISKTSYRNVNFVGCEPFHNINLLKEYINACVQEGLIPGVTTNGFWATTKEDASAILSELTGLRKILVSTDEYHLKYIPKEYIKNLFFACKENGVFVAINIVNCSIKERKVTQEVYQKLDDNLYIDIDFKIPEETVCYLREEFEKYNYTNRLMEVPNYCGVNDHYISCGGDVYACGMSTLSVETCFLKFGNLSEEKLSDILEMRKKNKIYQLLNKKGPKGLVELLIQCPSYESIIGHIFSSECELCVKILDDSKLYHEITHLLEEM